MSQPETLVTYPDRAGWLGTVAGHLRQSKPHSVVLSGSIIMLLSTILVSGVNFGFNVAMARILGPAKFSHVTAAVTILMLASAITLAFQLVCAKFVARNESAGARAGVYRSLLSRAWIVSLGVGAALVMMRRPVAQYLNLPNPWMLGVLALGICAYVPLGVRRGAMQGVCAFKKLSNNFIIESVTRLLAAILMVGLGHEVLGAVGAISVSVIAAYFLPTLSAEFKTKSEPASRPA